VIRIKESLFKWVFRKFCVKYNVISFLPPLNFIYNKYLEFFLLILSSYSYISFRHHAETDLETIHFSSSFVGDSEKLVKYYHPIVEYLILAIWVNLL
jgi:hypothetical protein